MPPYGQCLTLYSGSDARLFGRVKAWRNGAEAGFRSGGGKRERQGWISGSTKEGKKEETKSWKVKKQA